MLLLLCDCKRPCRAVVRGRVQRAFELRLDSIPTRRARNEPDLCCLPSLSSSSGSSLLASTRVSSSSTKKKLLTPLVSTIQVARSRVSLIYDRDWRRRFIEARGDLRPPPPTTSHAIASPPSSVDWPSSAVCTSSLYETRTL